MFSWLPLLSHESRGILQLAMNYNSTIKAKSYIDFFSGCGGLSLGLGWAGWDGVFAIEKDPMAYASFDRNLVAENAPHRHFPHWPEWLSREAHTIEDVLEDKEAIKHFKELSGKVTLVAGGPPCQGFSVAGARNGNDPRNLLVFKQIKAIDLLRPPFAMIENVEGFERKFVSRPHDKITVSVAEEAINEIKRIGYNIGKVVINAADYGVPQLRRRVILLAIAKDFIGEIDVQGLFTQVLKEVGIEQRRNLGLPTERYVTVGEAISDLAGSCMVSDPEFPNYSTCRYLKPKSAYERLMRMGMEAGSLPTCHRFNKHSEKAVTLYRKAIATQPAGRLSKEFLYENGCHSNKRFVLDVTRPCSTLTTAPEEIIHFRHPRVATLREMARIQSFPDDYQFCGRYTLNGPARGVDVPRNAQIGNAIPPLVGRAIGNALQRISEMAQSQDPRLENFRHAVDPKTGNMLLFDEA